MNRRGWGAWVVPLVLAAQVTLWLTGVYSGHAALAVGIGVEGGLWLFASTRLVAGVRRYNGARRSGSDRWHAMEEALGEVMPRRLARWILLDPRLLACLAGWFTGRHRRNVGGYGYATTNQRILFGFFIGLAALESTLTDLVLRLLFPGASWPWIVTACDGYLLLWLCGYAASFTVRPHVLTDTELRLRDGVLHELVIPRAAVVDVGPSPGGGGRRTGLRWAGTAVTMAHGEPRVRIFLDPGSPVVVDGRTVSPGPDSVTITVQDRTDFLTALLGSERALLSPLSRC